MKDTVFELTPGFTPDERDSLRNAPRLRHSDAPKLSQAVRLAACPAHASCHHSHTPPLAPPDRPA